MDESSKLVDGYKDCFAAEVYKSYLHCAAKIIRAEGGHIRSYDGDRIMGIFIGDSKCSDAARCGLKINYAVKNIINPEIADRYKKSPYKVKQVVGIDASSLFAARTGIRGSNDLVWVGRSANYAAKLTELSSACPTWITEDVYLKLNVKSKYSKGKDMWESRSWTAMDNMTIYCSTYWWKV
jgi:class 3 adenylate cyclase